jgi:hypothetical protein
VNGHPQQGQQACTTFHSEISSQSIVSGRTGQSDPWITAAQGLPVSSSTASVLQHEAIGRKFPILPDFLEVWEVQYRQFEKSPSSPVLIRRMSPQAGMTVSPQRCDLHRFGFWDLMHADHPA